MATMKMPCVVGSGGGEVELTPEFIKKVTSGTTTVDATVGDYIVINGENTNAVIPSITGGDVLFSKSGDAVRFDTVPVYSYIIIVKATSTSVSIGSNGYSYVVTKLNT